MAQNEMKAKPALPERVRSMEGLGVVVDMREADDWAAFGSDFSRSGVRNIDYILQRKASAVTAAPSRPLVPVETTKIALPPRRATSLIALFIELEALFRPSCWSVLTIPSDSQDSFCAAVTRRTFSAAWSSGTAQPDMQTMAIVEKASAVWFILIAR